MPTVPLAYDRSLPLTPIAQTVPTAAPRTASLATRTVLRRPDRTQGRALEVIGHALEYLVDSRMLKAGHEAWGVEKDALNLLSHVSQEVFGECHIVIPVRQRMAEWVHRWG